MRVGIIHRIQQRLRAGDRSGAVIASIVETVAPRLKVESLDGGRRSNIKKSRTPKSVKHILSPRLTSGKLVDLNSLGLANLDDATFLISLANGLEAAVNHGIDIAYRLGWNDTRSFLGLGQLNRVYYTQPTRQGGDDGEPDAFHRGIAPSVKLLHAVVTRIADLQPISAQLIVQRWHANGSPVFIRLWAALARNAQLVDADTVTAFLESLDDRQFWNLGTFPEITELRAMRFFDLGLESQNQIAARLRKGPPRNFWPKNADKAKVADARLYWAARELRRIEVAGGDLPTNAKKLVRCSATAVRRSRANVNRVWLS